MDGAYFLIFTPTWERFWILLISVQMGWFNRQLVFVEFPSFTKHSAATIW